jgi:hypothetical protein
VLPAAVCGCYCLTLFTKCEHTHGTVKSAVLLYSGSAEPLRLLQYGVVVRCNAHVSRQAMYQAVTIQ